MEHIVIIGNVTKDPMKAATKTGSQFVVVTVAVNGFNRGEKTVHYYDCSLFGKAAETAEKYIRKGTRLSVTGDLVINSYTKQDGTVKTSFGINNCSFEMLSSKKESSDQDEFTDISPADIPF